MDKPAQEQTKRAVRLLQNTIYPTYQLYAQMANKKTKPQDGLRLGALITLHWVKARLDDLQVEELADLPGVDEYLTAGDSCLKSFHINRGFLIEAVSLPGQGIWSLHITEPDLGSDPGNPQQSRQAVPGRIIETHVAFRVNAQALHCGFQIRISDPAGTVEKAEVYRLAIIRQLIAHPGFGLRQITPITAQVKEIANAEQLKEFCELCKSPDNQLPNVVFTQEKQPQPELKALPQMGELGIPKIGEMDLSLYSIPRTSTAAPADIDQALTYDRTTFARRTTAFCRTYALDESLSEKLSKQLRVEFSPGDILVFEPLCFGGGCTVHQKKESQRRRDEQLEQLRQEMCAYPREREISFGCVCFFAAAREALLKSTEDILSHSSELSQEWQRRISQREEQWRDVLAQRDQSYQELQEQLKRQKEYAERLEREKTQLQSKHDEESEAQAAILAEHEEEIAFLWRKINQPRALRDIPLWVEQNFRDKLLLLPVAADMLLDKNLQADVGMICDALDFLATDFWDNRYRRTSKEEMMTRCSRKYQRPFAIRPTGEEAIRRYPGEYLVKYAPAGGAQLQDLPLEGHLRVGNDAEKLVRIYFLYDDANQLIVVGSLPRHLSTIRC